MPHFFGLGNTGGFPWMMVRLFLFCCCCFFFFLLLLGCGRGYPLVKKAVSLHMSACFCCCLDGRMLLLSAAAVIIMRPAPPWWWWWFWKEWSRGDARPRNDAANNETKTSLGDNRTCGAPRAAPCWWKRGFVIFDERKKEIYVRAWTSELCVLAINQSTKYERSVDSVVATTTSVVVATLHYNICSFVVSVCESSNTTEKIHKIESRIFDWIFLFDTHPSQRTRFRSALAFEQKKKSRPKFQKWTKDWTCVAHWHTIALFGSTSF